MKQSPGDRELYARLGPSKFSGEGFLGTDARSVDEIITADERTLEHFGIDRESIVNALEKAYQQAREGLGADIEIIPGVTAVFYESMGRIPSPFRGDGVFEKGEAVITDTSSNDQMIITKLSVHLIKKHGFFQGKGSRFRIDPEKAIRILRIV